MCLQGATQVLLTEPRGNLSRGGVQSQSCLFAQVCGAGASGERERRDERGSVGRKHICVTSSRITPACDIIREHNGGGGISAPRTGPSSHPK